MDQNKTGYSKKMKNILAALYFFICGCSVVNSQQPQSLPKEKFQVCGQSLTLEIARDDHSRSLGLMYRDQVPDGTGMIFIFAQPQSLSFWMKNVPMDIDIAYFSKEGKYINHHTMKGTSPVQSTESLPSYPSFKKAKYAVEVQAGFYSKVKSLPNCAVSPLL